MNKLNKAQCQEKARLITALQECGTQVEEAVAKYNAAMTEAIAPVNEVVQRYNQLLAEARTFAEEIAADARTFYDEKSEKWQSGERGEQYNEWVESWENLYLSDVEIDPPNELEVPSFESVGELDQVPDEPGVG